MNVLNYKWWWTRFGGRKWTWIIRDTWHKVEVVWIIGLVSIGVWMGHHFDWLTVLKIFGIFTIGLLAGHLFWGKKYIAGQQ